AADQAVRIRVHVTQSKGSGVAQPDAVLVFRLVVLESRCSGFDDEPAWARRSVRQNGVSARNPPVADPLLAAVQLVADDAVAVRDPVRRALQRAEVAARVRLGRAV